MQKDNTPRQIELQDLTPEFLKRFWSRIHKSDGCWEWIGGRDRRGYGYIGLDASFGKSRTIKTHRAAWTIHYGLIPEGLCVLHHCDNPPCVRPDHLFVGTNLDNIINKMEKGRAALPMNRGEGHGLAKLNAEQVLQIRELYATGKFSYREVGERFGVFLTNIRSIVKRDSWKHIWQTVRQEGLVSRLDAVAD